jgi:hypothetical protein
VRGKEVSVLSETLYKRGAGICWLQQKERDQAMRFRRSMQSTILSIATSIFCLAQTAVPQNAAHSKPNSPAPAQGPSLTETTSWLSERIAEAGISGGKSDAIAPGVDTTDASSLGSFRAEWNGCKLVLHYIQQDDIHQNDTTGPNRSNEVRGTISYDVTVNLSFLSEAVGTSEAKPWLGLPLTAPAWNVTLTARGNDQPFVTHSVSSIINSGNFAVPASQTERTYDNSSGGLYIPFGSAEIAGRVAKAFSHAIHLCSQKKEPF